MRRVRLSLVVAVALSCGSFVGSASIAKADSSTRAASIAPATVDITSTCVVGPLNQVVCIPDSPDQTICTIELTGEFNGVDTNGAISGTWTADANTKCNVQMRFLEVQSSISGPPGANSGPTDVCGLQINIPNCSQVDSPDAFTCGFCNGQWLLTGSYVLQFPFPVTTLTYDQRACTQVAVDELKCSIAQGATLIG
jgi:hypothetical protein